MTDRYMLSKKYLFEFPYCVFWPFHFYLTLFPPTHTPSPLYLTGCCCLLKDTIVSFYSKQVLWMGWYSTPISASQNSTLRFISNDNHPEASIHSQSNMSLCEHLIYLFRDTCSHFLIREQICNCIDVSLSLKLLSNK